MNDINLEISFSEKIMGYMSSLAGWESLKVPIKINFTKPFAKCLLDNSESLEYSLKLNEYDDWETLQVPIYAKSFWSLAPLF